MSGRTDWLTEFAKPVADELAARMGSLKRVLSAGVLALNDLTPDKREYYMARSVGKELPENDKIFKDISAIDSIEVVKHLVRYKILNADQQRALDSLRKLLADDSATQAKAERQKRKSHRRSPKEAG